MLTLVTLESGPLLGSFVMRAGESVRIGRGDEAEIAIPHDDGLARVHCALQAGDHRCRVRDLGSPRGTWAQGQRVVDAVIQEGTPFTIGSTVVRVRTRQDALEPPSQQVIVTTWSPATDQPERAAVDRLLGRGERALFAVLDPARSPEIRAMLGRSGEEHGCLVTGRDGARLATHAPYLVELPMGSPFVATLAREAWGKSWGVFLASEHPYDDVLAALQRVLIVETTGGRPALFRFYDPRVLRVFLPIATRLQADLLFAAARSFWMEGPSPGVVLAFSRTSREGLGPDAPWA